VFGMGNGCGIGFGSGLCFMSCTCFGLVGGVVLPSFIGRGDKEIAKEIRVC